MDRIIGQSRALKTLQSQVDSGRVHHAQIFHGPAGVGKFTMALAFARLRLCHDPLANLHGSLSACGRCKSCQLLPSVTEDAPETTDIAAATLASAHPDLHLVTKELALFDDDANVRARKLTTIPVNVIREHLIAPAHLAPKLGHGKIFIVDEAELLAPAGQNALLKTLEEPPTTGGGTSVILVTSSEDRLLATIRSRCQRVPFAPLSDDEVGRWLERHAEGLDDKTRRWIVGFAQGSVGRASLAVEYDLIEWGQSVLGPISQIAQAGRAAPHLGAAIADRVDGYAKAWVASHKNASKEAANRQAADLMGSMIANFARRQLSQIARDCDPEQPALSEAALEPWLNVIEAISDARRQLAANVNLTLVCEGMAMAIHAALLGTPAQR